MRVRFWGTRGSIAKPGPATLRYGGNTSCVQVVTRSGTLIVVDCGTGAHDLGHKLVQEARGPMRGHILISHTHWDHIQGIPFFQPLFESGGRWDFYAPQGFGESIRDTLAGQMEYTYFPVTPEAFGAEVRYNSLSEGSFRIADDVTVRTRYLNHPALTLAYRIEADGASLVYACDHEPHSRALALGQGPVAGQDELHARFLDGADLVIHDAQYTAAEYGSKVGWGHGTAEYAAEVCAAAGVRRLALTHHDPLRSDSELDRIVKAVAKRGGKRLQIFAAAEGMTLDLAGAKASASRAPRVPAEPGPAAEAPLLLLATADMAAAKTIGGAINGESVDVDTAKACEAALLLYRRRKPTLVIADDALPGGGGVALSKAIRKRGDESVPIMILGEGAAPDAIAGDSATDWLQAPFSQEYARARIHTWLMRGQFRWERAGPTGNETERLAALARLNLLDTEPDERFDRFTRLAAALFDVPIALVSLIDANRQWFKSCVGFDGRESSREVSFCAHAIHRREVMVVPDALADDRFADNPLVTGKPRMRFYAGVPLFVENGLCMGTLCLIDLRPRAFPEEKARLLSDLGALVEQELARAAASGPR